MPTEYLGCTSKSSGGKSGNEGGNPEYITSPDTLIDTLPEGYFTVNTDIRANIEQNAVVQRIIMINSTSSYDYFLEIQYPSAYTGGTEFISTTTDKKYIENIGDFNIIIDTRDILIGTYVIPIKIYNKDYSKIIGLTMNIVPVDSPNIELNLDSKIKIQDVNKDITTFLKVAEANNYANNTVTYSIIDPKGNIIYSEDKVNVDLSKTEHAVKLPQNIGEGYYTLAIKINSDNKTYVKSELFTILPPNKYTPVVQEPDKKLGMFVWICIIIVSLITLYNTGLFYKSRMSEKNRRIRAMRTKQDVSDTGTPILSMSQRIKNFMNKTKKKEEINNEQKLGILKKNYNHGFISLKEYHDIAKTYGYDINISTLEENRQEQIKKQDSEPKKDLKELKDLRTDTKAAETIKEGEIREEMSKIEKEPPQQNVKESLIKDKTIFETPLSERLLPENSAVGSIARMFTQNTLEKRTNHEQAFVLNNNERLYSIRELLNTLPYMSEPTFNHHTAHGRNDFANWIGDVFKYYDIAEEIRNAKSREEMITILKKH
ncbi:MAG: hypothetical protein ACP5OA_04940, partial [Candidatus Woesearchaeota archaeon]